MSAVAPQLSLLKMHGTHNEFFVLDERTPHSLDYAALARRICDRGTGDGADGLIVIAPPTKHPSLATMRIFNADGSEAEMCGNGVRCVARYLAERGAGDAFAVDTLAGPIGLEVIGREPEFLVRVSIGSPELVNGPRPHRVDLPDSVWHVHEVRLGNPHAVIFVGDVDAFDLERLGPAIATHPKFPGGINVHVAQVLDKRTMRVRHYERGVGLTQACGTGVVAAAAVGILMGSVISPVTVLAPGGKLEVAWYPGKPATLTGPAEIIGERAISL